MKYRKMSPSGDYVFGSGSQFLENSPEAVAQAILTRVRLFVEEWFLDLKEGLDLKRILGVRTAATRDAEVKRRIVGTPGVKSLVAYSSTVRGRSFSVSATVNTIYGPLTIKETF